MSIKNIKEARIGIGYGLAAGATWGVDTVLVGIFMVMSPFADTQKAILLAPFISTFMHDSFSAIWATIYMIFKGQFKNVIKAVKSKGGLFIILGALVGGPIGMTCYLTSINYVGAAYAASISAIFPAVSAVLAFIFLKEKMNLRVWLGVVLSIVGIIVLGYVPAQLNVSNHFLLGIILALGTAFAWGFEGVICAFGMKYGEVDPEHAINIRQATSGLFYAIVIIPLIGGYGIASQAITSKVGLIIAITAIFGTASYIQYYKAISIIGAARSTALNITYGVWAIAIQAVFFKTTVSSQLLIGAIIVIIGSMLVSGNPKELIDFNKDEFELVNN
jgi:drug/metabolite transporter (DMT)-like permease